MQKVFLLIWMFSFGQLYAQDQVASSEAYLAEIIEALSQKWPDNRTINLVFHGHSVPAGYFKTPAVKTLESYPYQVLQRLKERYPFAVINIINTSIGGENSVKGAARFETSVLNYQPDVLFIDYALNDRRVGLAKAKEAWEDMIQKALEQQTKIILLSPSPDQGVNLLEANNILEQHRNQIEQLANTYQIGFVDSYRLFKEKLRSGEEISTYMSQINHPNAQGHSLIADEIATYFLVNP